MIEMNVVLPFMMYGIVYLATAEQNRCGTQSSTRNGTSIIKGVLLWDVKVQYHTILSYYSVSE